MGARSQTQGQDAAKEGLADQLGGFFSNFTGGDMLQTINNNRGKVFMGIGAIFGFQKNGLKGGIAYAAMAGAASWLLSGMLDKFLGKQTEGSKEPQTLEEKQKAAASNLLKESKEELRAQKQEATQEAQNAAKQVASNLNGTEAEHVTGTGGPAPSASTPSVNKNGTTVTVG